MKIDIVLGVNIDTSFWISYLLERKAEHIVILDYDYNGETFTSDNITHIAAYNLKNYLQNFSDIRFYKSIYGYPIINQKN